MSRNLLGNFWATTLFFNLNYELRTHDNSSKTNMMKEILCKFERTFYEVEQAAVGHRMKITLVFLQPLLGKQREEIGECGFCELPPKTIVVKYHKP